MTGHRALVLGACAATLVSLGCAESRNEVPVVADESAPRFVERSVELGIDFHHTNARSGEKYYMETTASGGGLFDYDDDGDLDVYLVNGAPTRGSGDPPTPPINRLYENRDGAFVDVTARAGVGDPGYGQGVCVGDVDGDGRLDFLVTNYGPDRLFRSTGDGRFDEIAEEAGLAVPMWSLGCAFGDLDSDGDLDLYVTRYVNFSYDNNPRCGDSVRNLRGYCRPDAFRGLIDSLYINDGSGRFVDESAKRGINQEDDDRGMGVILTDIDLDDDLDIFVANDASPNRFYINDGAGHFTDQALLCGIGVSRDGRSQSCMGVDLGDVDGDGRMDLIVTNFSMETNTLYRNMGNLIFDDRSIDTGVGRASLKTVAWGTRFIDYDNDADFDLVIANGAVDDNIEDFDPTLESMQRNTLLENDGNGGFTDISDDLGPDWQRKRLSRGLATGDWNNDGRLDVLFTNTNDPADLFENRYESENHWLGLKLRAHPPNVFAIGARVEVRAGDTTQYREVRSGGSFASQSDLRLHFGLGTHAGPVSVEIRWPDGRTSSEDLSEIDRYVTLTQPGKPVE